MMDLRSADRHVHVVHRRVGMRRLFATPHSKLDFGEKAALAVSRGRTDIDRAHDFAPPVSGLADASRALRRLCQYSDRASHRGACACAKNDEFNLENHIWTFDCRVLKWRHVVLQ